MKLYIPSCTLNVSNIMSTGSISPDGIYKTRKFGIRRYHSLGLSENMSVIVLFSEFPYFQLPSDGKENYYMVISIETEDFPEDYFIPMLSGIEGIKMFACSKTIYLNPFNCRFYLPSVDAMSSANFMCKQTLEAKFAQLYGNNFILKSAMNSMSTEGSFDLNNLVGTVTKDEESHSIPQIDVPESKCDCEGDYLTDKILGFIYSYVIGANGYFSKDLAALYYQGRMLCNKFSAIIHSPERKPLPSQVPVIEQMIKEFNDLCDIVDENKQANNVLVRNRIKEYLDRNGDYQGEESVEYARKTLEIFGYYHDFYTLTPGLVDYFDANELWMCVDAKNPDEVFKRLISKMNNHLRRIHKKELEKISKVALNECFEIGENGIVSIVDPAFPNAKSFYSKIINMLLHDNHKAIMEEAEVNETEAIVYNGGVMLKDILGDTTDEMALQGLGYIRQLYASLDENVKFDVSDSASPILQSFAAFSLQHDDILNLDNYLELCKIPDRRLAYGLLGALYGFASLPKNFTTSLIDEDKDYFKSVFTSLYELLHQHKLSSTEYPDKLVVEKPQDNEKKEDVKPENDKSDSIEAEEGKSDDVKIVDETKPLKKRKTSTKEPQDINESIIEDNAAVNLLSSEEEVSSKNSKITEVSKESTFGGDTKEPIDALGASLE